MHLSVGISLTYPGSASLTGAGAFLADYSSDGQGYAHYFSGATPSVKIVDSGTPANNVDTSLASFDAYNNVLTYTSPSAKNVMQSDGFVKYSAHNVCLQSETFTNASWSKSDATVTGGQVDRNGGSTATKLEGDGTAGHVYIRQTPTLVLGNTYKHSVVAKADEVDWLLLLTTTYGGTLLTYFNLDTVAVGATDTASGVIEDLGDGWCKCTITIPATASTSGTIRIYAASANGTPAEGDDALSSIFIDESHLFNAPADETYLPTTTTARYALPIEYDTSGDAIGVLVEPAATNLLLYSLISPGTGLASGWATQGASASDSATVDPFGTSNAIEITTTTNLGNNFVNFVSGLTASQVYTGSAYFRGTSGEKIYFAANTSQGSTCAVLVTFTGEWQRITSTFTASGTIAYFGAELFDRGGPDSEGTLANVTFEMTGAQLETGTVATSPIATAGSTVTRLADNLSIPTSAFPYSATATTMFADLTSETTVPNGLDMSGGGAIQAAAFASSTEVRAYVYSSIYEFGNYQTNSTPPTKVALAFQANDGAAHVNGVHLGVDDTSGAVPTLSSMRMLGASGNAPMLFRSIAYIPERITDANLVVMTT